MSNVKTLKLYMDPFLIWNNLAWESGQMALASTQVFFKRLVRDRSLKNSGSHSYTFTAMGQDKVKASLESAQAVGVNMIMLNQQLVSLAMKQMQSVHSAITAIVQSRSPAETLNLQTRLMAETLTISTVAASTVSGSGARLARSAIKPVMKRVQRNGTRGKKR